MSKSKTVLITGATGGIGSALAEEYSKARADLILLGRNQTTLNTVSRRCIDLGATVHTYCIDQSSIEETLALSKSISQKHEVDLVISNAGLTNSTHNGLIEPWKATQALLTVNLESAIAITHPIIELMQQRKQGHVAYISSLAGYYGMSVTPAYSASKAGLRAYAEAMRVLLAKDSVAVTLVTPGFVKTEMSDQFPADKPFMISAKLAAKKIKRGLDKKQRVITFPRILSLGMRCLSVLPASVSDFILSTLKY